MGGGGGGEGGKREKRVPSRFKRSSVSIQKQFHLDSNDLGLMCLRKQRVR